MARVKFKIVDIGRIQKKYPLVRHLPVPRLTADRLTEIETLTIELNQESEKSATFSEPFTDIPAVAVTLLTDLSPTPVGSVNVYAYTVSKTGITVRASADITARVAVQAIYIGA